MAAIVLRIFYFVDRACCRNRLWMDKWKTFVGALWCCLSPMWISIFPCRDGD